MESSSVLESCIQRIILAKVSERRVSYVVAKRDGFCKLCVEAKVF